VSDLGRILSRALEDVAAAYTPSDIGAARARFEARRRRRRGVRIAAAATALAAAVVAGVVVSRPFGSEPRIPAEGGDPGAPRGRVAVTRAFEVGLSPVDVEVGEELVYVSHEERDAAFAIDPRTGEVALELPSIPGDPPTSIALGGRRLYGVNRALGRLYAYDITSGVSPGSVATGPQPTDVAFGGGLVWVASSRPGGPPDRYVVTAYDSRLRRVRAYRVPVIAGLEYGYGYMWAATSRGLFRLDPGSGDVDAVARVRAASDASAGFGAVWVYENPARGGPRSGLVRVDAATARVTKRIPVEGFFGKVEAMEGAGIWVLTSRSESERDLLRLEPSSGKPLGKGLRLEGGVMEIAARGDVLWLTDSSQGILRRIEVVEPGR